MGGVGGWNPEAEEQEPRSLPSKGNAPRKVSRGRRRVVRAMRGGHRGPPRPDPPPRPAPSPLAPWPDAEEPSGRVGP